MLAGSRLARAMSWSRIDTGLRLRIDPEAIKGRGLTVSAQLYDVAEVLE